MTQPRPIVVALGGNALSPSNSDGGIDSQFDQTRETAGVLAGLIAQGERLVITHGNGPQVGNAIRRVELSRHEVYGLPLDICVADLQGGMGYMIALCVNNELDQLGIDQRVTAMVTSIEVAADDPAFENPTKPIGPYYDNDRATYYRAEFGWDMVEVRGQGFRRVVPSPRPRHIVEIDALRQMIADGQTVIAAGGGGVPVTRNGTAALSGREAVIDKDLASALLATEIGASTLLIVTGVAQVAVDFGTAEQRNLSEMSVDEVKQYLDDGQFPPGSMGPKMQAAINFLEATPHDDARVIITDIPSIQASLAGEAGTVIRRTKQRAASSGG